MPTLAEKWMQQGEERGRHTGHLELLTRILNRKFGPLDHALQTRLEALSTADLEQMSDQLLDWSTVDELQKWLATRS